MKRVLISILARVKGNVNANGTIAGLTEIKKFFTTDGETRVYVSGRCVKYCIKQRLHEKEFELSPLKRPRRVMISKGNPVLYIDDDLFGFMIAEVPGEIARRRFAPIKTDGIIALKHCEITRDFGGRFDPTEKEMPSPFEVEVADFIGQNNWILTENIGKFEEKEITEEIIQNSPVELEEKEENGKKYYYLPPEPSDDSKRVYGRKNRLRAYKIEDLGSLLTHEEKITIIDFEHALDEEVRLRIENHKKKIEELKNKLKSTDDNELKKKLEDEKQELEYRIKTLENIEIVNPYKIDNVIDEIVNYLIGA